MGICAYLIRTVHVFLKVEQGMYTHVLYVHDNPPLFGIFVHSTFQVSTNGGYYKLAPKDASVLDRISKRAQHHSSRVRKPHEVSSARHEGVWSLYYMSYVFIVRVV